MFSLTACVFVGAVVAVLVAVAEEAALDAVAVAAGEVVLLADGLVGEEQRLHLLLLRLGLAVGHRRLPVARLLLDVERQARRTPDRLQALRVVKYLCKIILLTKMHFGQAYQLTPCWT